MMAEGSGTVEKEGQEQEQVREREQGQGREQGQEQEQEQEQLQVREREQGQGQGREQGQGQEQLQVQVQVQVQVREREQEQEQGQEQGQEREQEQAKSRQPEELECAEHEFELYSLGDSAIAVRLGSEISPKLQQRVRELAAFVEARRFPGFVELVAAYATLTVFYDPWLVYHRAGSQTAAPYVKVELHLRGLLEEFVRTAAGTQGSAGKLVKLPVCYGGVWGPDLPEVAAYHGMTEQEVVELHSACEYPVYMIGFAPGFAYLGGLPDKLATPRRSTPRAQIAAGSVGIGGAQTGVYPLATPGGWQLIGRTPLALFRPHEAQPSLLEAGDRVRFVPIAWERFAELAAAEGGIDA